MSLRSRKVSAFSVFKNRKATSLTNVDKAAATPIDSSKKKSTSAGNTPTNATPTGRKNTSLTSISSKSSNAEKKKQKAELKKIKKLLKSSSKSKKRPSYLPDSALQSPLLNSLPNGNVELKSLRPKGSMANINYQLPLKATPDVIPKPPSASKSGRVSPKKVVKLLSKTSDTTPPLPPRAGRRKGVAKSATSDSLDRGPASSTRQALKRVSSPPRAGPSPKTTPKVTAVQLSGENDTAPPRPPKRRKLSSGSVPSSPQKAAATPQINEDSGTSYTVHFPKRSLGILSPESARQHKEPLPIHPAVKESGLPYMYDSLEEAGRLFECLIHPVKPNKFFSELWEKKPLLVKRHMQNYNDGWFSTQDLDRILRDEKLNFTDNIDVTSYDNGKRETHNPAGRAYAPVVWDYYQNGCSVRLLNPHSYNRNVWKMISILQEYFDCSVGANCYLTPPGTQGFAPHYDDIEVFILQLEGKKHWRLYSPREESEVLPRFPSPNFTDEDIGEPILDVILEAGDLLYFPRGTIHQGKTVEDVHSLHITVSCCQKNTWGDFLDKLVPRALQIALEEDSDFRKTLPIDYLKYMGVAFSDSESPGRQSFLRTVEQLMVKLLAYAPVDAAADQMGRDYIHDCLPPVLTEEIANKNSKFRKRLLNYLFNDTKPLYIGEKACSVHGNGDRWDVSLGRVVGSVELEPDTRIKIIRRGAVRLVTEEDKVCVYHTLENAKVLRGNEIQYIEITAQMAPAVEYLLNVYPEYTSVESLPLETLTENLELATALYEKGLVITEKALEPLSDSEVSEEEDNSEK